MVSKFNGSIIDYNPNSSENSEFHPEMDVSLESSQNSLISKQNSSQSLDSADSSHCNVCISRDGHDLDTSVERSMLHCTNFQPAVDAQLLCSNSSIPATENEINNSNSTHDHEHNKLWNAES